MQTTEYNQGWEDCQDWVKAFIEQQKEKGVSVEAYEVLQQLEKLLDGLDGKEDEP